jgi:hypothetical protein
LISRRKGIVTRVWAKLESLVQRQVLDSLD